MSEFCCVANYADNLIFIASSKRVMYESNIFVLFPKVCTWILIVCQEITYKQLNIIANAVYMRSVLQVLQYTTILLLSQLCHSVLHKHHRLGTIQTDAYI